MTRRLLDILAAFSLLLFAATTVVWVRSYFVRDIVGFGFAGRNDHFVQSILGRLHLVSGLHGGYTGGVWHTAHRLAPNTMWNSGMSGYPPRVNWCCGFVWQTYSKIHLSLVPIGEPAPITHHRLIVMPYWFPAAVFAIPPGVWLPALRRRWRRRYRLTHGLCLTCGYNLTGNVSGRCPECGMPVTPCAELKLNASS
jgi:hypothetical protein